MKTIVLLLSLLAFPAYSGDSDINFAPGINPKDIHRIHPKLRDMLRFIAAFCKQENIKFVITSMIRTEERNKAVGSVSKTHVEGRAVDFSIKEQWGWTPELVWHITQKVIRNYKEYGAFSNVNGKQVVIFTHDAGTGTHVHLQVHRLLPWK